MMNMTTTAPSKAEAYMRTLSTLDDNVKIELISLLSKSIINKYHHAESDSKPIDLYHCFGGDWGNGIPTDEYCSMLREDGVNTIAND